MDEDGEGPGSDEIACTCVRVSFLSKLIAVETITLERPPDHSITTLLYRHRPRPSVITVWQPDGKRPGPASSIKFSLLYKLLRVFSRDPPSLSFPLLSRFSHLHHSRSHPVPVEIVGARGTRS